MCCLFLEFCTIRTTKQLTNATVFHRALYSDLTSGHFTTLYLNMNMVNAENTSSSPLFLDDWKIVKSIVQPTFLLCFKVKNCDILLLIKRIDESNVIKDASPLLKMWNWLPYWGYINPVLPLKTLPCYLCQLIVLVWFYSPFPGVYYCHLTLSKNLKRKKWSCTQVNYIVHCITCIWRSISK